MLKRTLTAAVSAAIFSLPMMPYAATITVDPGTPLITPEQAVQEQAKIRAMPPEERKEYLKTEHEKRTEEMKAEHGRRVEERKAEHEKRVEELKAEHDKRVDEMRAAMPVPPAPASEALAVVAEAQPVAAEAGSADAQAEVPAGETMPTAEEMKARHEKLRQMTPDERHKYMREEHEKMREQMQTVRAEIPAPPEPPTAMAPPAIPAPPAMPMEAPVAPDQSMSIEERRAYFNRRYQELRERATQEGVDLPARPPWTGRGMGRQLMSDEERAGHREVMRNMTPEQREAYRKSRYEMMRERGKEAGMEMPETPPWETARQEMLARQQARADKLAGYRDRVSNLSPEDREAVQALGRIELQRRMQRLRREMQAWAAARSERMPEAPYSQGTPFGQGYPVQPEAGYGQGYPNPPGYGGGYANPWGYGR